ncbi:MAG: MFS transporter [Proteobacteria bacterium]|nr:MFS transporter [Pseudomonadota bacterium]
MTRSQDADRAKKTTVLVVVTVGSFVTPFMGSSVNVALPAIQQAFGLDAIMLSWVATSFLLSAAIFMVPFGRLADIHGRKRTFAWGMLVYTAASVLAALSFSGTMLLATRVLQGLGSAMIFTSGLAILTSVFPPGERGRAMGIAVGAVYIGLSMGPVLGGILTQNLGWRSVFLAPAPVGLLSVALVFWKLKDEWAEARGERFDLTGSIFFGLALVAVMYGLSRLPAPSSFGLIGLGLFWAAVFIWWEQRTPQPVIEISLFRRNRVFAFSNLAALINYSATFAVTFLLSLYLQYIKAFKPQTAGLILVTQPLVQAVCSPLAGRLSDRIQPRLVASVGMALTAVGLAVFTALGPETPAWFMIGNLVVMGLGFGLFSSPNTNAIMSSVEKRHLGIASGAVSTMRLLGQMTSMGIATLIFALVIGPFAITPDRYPQFLESVRIAFMIFSLLCLFGVAASMIRGRLPANRSGD